VIYSRFGGRPQFPGSFIPFARQSGDGMPWIIEIEYPFCHIRLRRPGMQIVVHDLRSLLVVIHIFDTHVDDIE
jgi:hypothetical protein